MGPVTKKELCLNHTLKCAQEQFRPLARGKTHVSGADRKNKAKTKQGFSSAFASALYTSTAFQSTGARDIFCSSDWKQVLTQSFVLLFQLSPPYLSSAAFSHPFSPTDGKIKLRKETGKQKHPT